jgi:hypothetical protein
MASKRRYRFRRRRRIPKRYYSKTKKMVTGQSPTLLERIATGAGSVARVAKAVLPIVSAINTEEKYVDIAINVNAYSPGTNDQIIALTSPITQGTADTERIGNSVLLRSIYIRGLLQWTSATGSYVGVSRFILFCWKGDVQNNPPTAAKIFENPTQFFSMLNKDYSEQIVVIKDKVVNHAAPFTTAGVFGIKFFKIYKSLNWHARWDGTTNNDGTTNHLFLLVRGAGTSTTPSNMVAYSRLHFTDN